MKCAARNSEFRDSFGDDELRPERYVTNSGTIDGKRFKQHNSSANFICHRTEKSVWNFPASSPASEKKMILATMRLAHMEL
jgi:hypothetical protein